MKTVESENVSKLKLNGKKEREAITRKKGNLKIIIVSLGDSVPGRC